VVSTCSSPGRFGSSSDIYHYRRSSRQSHFPQPIQVQARYPGLHRQRGHVHWPGALGKFKARRGTTTYNQQFIYAGKHATLTIGNILPLSSVPEGTVLTNVEEKTADRGALGRTSGNYVTVIGHNFDDGKTRVKLPSGAKKVLPSNARGMVGIVAGGGRTDKPLLKASRAKHKVRQALFVVLERC